MAMLMDCHELAPFRREGCGVLLVATNHKHSICDQVELVLTRNILTLSNSGLFYVLFWFVLELFCFVFNSFVCKLCYSCVFF